MRLLWQQRARTELREAIRYYRDEGGLNIAQDFHNAAMQAAGRLLEYPELGVRIKHACRRFNLNDYPYSLIYRVTPVAITIVAVAHHSRRPGYWAGRR